MKNTKKKINGLQLLIIIVMWYLLASSFIGSLFAIGTISNPSGKFEKVTWWWIVKLALCAISCVFVAYHTVWGRKKANHWLMPAISIIIMLAFQIPAFVNGEDSIYPDIIMLMAFGLAGFTFSFAFYRKPVGIWICYLFALLALILACAGVQVNECKNVYSELTKIQMAASTISIWTPTICVGAYELSYLFNKLDDKR